MAAHYFARSWSTTLGDIGTLSVMLYVNCNLILAPKGQIYIFWRVNVLYFVLRVPLGKSWVRCQDYAYVIGRYGNGLRT
jgi:hypothetical protein